MDTYGRRVYRWCRQAGLQAADANNVAQDVFSVIARKLSTFEYRQDGDSFRGWMRRITQNKIRDHFRKVKKIPKATGGTQWFRQVADLPAADHAEIANHGNGDPTGDTSRRDDTHDSIFELHNDTEESAIAQKLEFVQHVKNSVSQRDWKLFWRVVVDGQSAVEVGEEFGVTANTVRIVKMRVLRKLRQQIADTRTKGSNTKS